MKNCKEIWGVNLDGEVTPVMVRDAIIRCFEVAHASALDDIDEYTTIETEKEKEEFKKLNARLLVESFITEEGGDLEKPTKEDLMKLVGKLKEFSANFRDLKMIKKHASEIMQLINKLN